MKMTPETKKTLKKIGGILILMAWTVMMVFMLTPQLTGTTLERVAIVIVGAVGLAFILVLGLKLVVVNNNHRHRQQ